jgi:hypothetical protein
VATRDEPIPDSQRQARRRRPALAASNLTVSAVTGPSTPPVPEMLTVADAMALSRIGKTAIYNAASKGAFPLKKFGRRTLIPRAAFMAFLHNLPDAETRKTAA